MRPGPVCTHGGVSRASPARSFPTRGKTGHEHRWAAPRNRDRARGRRAGILRAGVAQLHPPAVHYTRGDRRVASKRRDCGRKRSAQDVSFSCRSSRAQNSRVPCWSKLNPVVRTGSYRLGMPTPVSENVISSRCIGLVAEPVLSVYPV
jgi:hypothetical protein